MRVSAWLREEEGNFFLVISFFEEHSHSFDCSFFSFFSSFPSGEVSSLEKERLFSLFVLRKDTRSPKATSCLPQREQQQQH